MIGRPLRALGRSRTGSTAAEFAIIVPVLMIMVLASLQFGMIFFANAGLNNAVAEGAREATLFPRRTAAEVRARITSGQFGLDPQKLETPIVTFGSDAGQDFVEVTVTYNAVADFGLFSLPTIRLTETRRAYMP